MDKSGPLSLKVPMKITYIFSDNLFKITTCEFSVWLCSDYYKVRISTEKIIFKSAVVHCSS
jgi:hypothetical protein